jgi:hypothetical protein
MDESFSGQESLADGKPSSVESPMAASKIFSTSSYSLSNKGLKTISGAGPFGKSESRSLDSIDSLVHDNSKRISACENWRIREPSGKSNSRLRLVSSFGSDLNPGPGQYNVSHNQNSIIEGAPKAVLSFRPKNVSATKLDVTDISGKIIYDTEKANKKSSKGPNMGSASLNSMPEGKLIILKYPNRSYLITNATSILYMQYHTKFTRCCSQTLMTKRCTSLRVLSSTKKLDHLAKL